MVVVVLYIIVDEYFQLNMVIYDVHSEPRIFVLENPAAVTVLERDNLPSPHDLNRLGMDGGSIERREKSPRHTRSSRIELISIITDLVNYTEYRYFVF